MQVIYHIIRTKEGLKVFNWEHTALIAIFFRDIDALEYVRVLGKATDEDIEQNKSCTLEIQNNYITKTV